MTRYWCFAVLGLWAVQTVQPVAAQTSYPMVMALKPVAVQVGATLECEVESRYSLRGCHQVFISGTDVTAEIIPPEEASVKPGDKPKDLTKLKLKLTAASDAAEGPREFRLASPQGASTIGQLVVVRDPVIYEQADNNTAEAAQTIVLPAAMCGAIEKAEDSDFWKFHVNAGESLVFHVVAQRLQNKIHDLQNHIDPILFLRDPTGSVIGMSDNHYFADPFLAHTFAKEGDYVLEIRDVRYQGNVHWQYCVEANARPFISQVSPLAIAAGTETALQVMGVHLAEKTTATLSLPVDVEGIQRTALMLNGELTNPVHVLATRLPRVDEAAADNNTLEQAMPVTLPVMISGSIGQEADLDTYVFEAKKGDLLSLETFSRRLESQLDSYLRILNEKGQVLKEDDDMRSGKLSHSDTLIDGWAVPADGRYFVEVRDVHLRGGAGFGYALKIAPSQPSMELAIDTDKTNLSPGNYGVLFVRVTRKHGFTGEVALQIDGLPPGVTATCGRILEGKSLDGAIVLAAAADAPPGMSRITVRGTAVHPRAEGESPLELTAVAVPYQEIYLPGGGRGHFLADDHVVCVGESADIRSIRLSETDVRLKPGESRKITVTLERSSENKANISIDGLFQHLSQVYANTLPPGVTIDLGQSQSLLSAGAVEGCLTLKAAPTAAPVEKQLCNIMANISINFVMKATYGSPPLWISVEPASAQ